MAAALADAEVQRDPHRLLSAWVDQTLTLRLPGAGHTYLRIGSHLRRSFLGALGPGASPEAQAGAACPWDPPCALDVFRREQLRGARGDGLPKPYVISTWPDGDDLMVSLRIFGMAIDWALVAFEALVTGIRTILPWSKIARALEGPPQIVQREISTYSGAASGFSTVTHHPVTLARLEFLSPMDATGTNVIEQPHSILARALRRVDGLSRWCGVVLDPEVGARLAQQTRALRFDMTNVRLGQYSSANRHAQQRRDKTIKGQILFGGELAELWPLLLLAERGHIGRHAVEGLGRIRLSPGALPH
ncbi:CRISPR system precrRNA processing endoribonuclease RAMP protein Cas6 [Phaeobacter sp. HF9A]|uniref:CRISPR system precrRNA processing endoribonuclease RAMP protein Cas6 n=1 Tax=Phaeobacter sp. HF9A TaxID=2721561 RepID=UPI0014313FAC|nr:CRISPR system precrRNA processing endoribonuclease RAMP protein Cas6 [Phaeobacter sp. HF9A]NIZ11938.1 CRISPR system precrRNA processing endoribonuclease RAMP protein Cas6 [Phaeobacter sp. HF9A]